MSICGNWIDKNKTERERESSPCLEFTVKRIKQNEHTLVVGLQIAQLVIK